MEHDWRFARRSKTDEGNWNYFGFAAYWGGDGDIFVAGRGTVAAQEPKDSWNLIFMRE